MPDLLTFGEPLCVFHPASGETLTRGVAGAELNVAVGLARLGRSVVYVSRVGDDPFGAAIRERLTLAGVDARIEVDMQAPTGVYFRELAGAAGRSVFYYRHGSAATRLEPVQLPPLGEFRLVHTTGITAMLSPGCRATVEAAAHAPAFSLDVNFRPALGDAEAWRAALRPLLPLADLVFLSEEDAAVIAPAAALAAGAAAVVHTRGAAGALYLDRAGHEIEARAVAVEAVDTVGAGDAFAAGFLDAYLAGRSPAACLDAGCRLGAEAVARVGDQA